MVDEATHHTRGENHSGHDHIHPSPPHPPAFPPYLPQTPSVPPPYQAEHAPSRIQANTSSPMSSDSDHHIITPATGTGTGTASSSTSPPAPSHPTKLPGMRTTARRTARAYARVIDKRSFDPVSISPPSHVLSKDHPPPTMDEPVILFDTPSLTRTMYRQPKMRLLDDISQFPVAISAIDRMEMASLKKGSTNAARAKVQRELLMSEDEKWGHILPSDGTPGQGPCIRCIKMGYDCIVPLKCDNEGNYSVAAICIGCKLSFPCDMTHGDARGYSYTSDIKPKREQLDPPPKVSQPAKRPKASTSPKEEIVSDDEEEDGDEMVKALRGMDEFIAEMKSREQEDGPMDYGTRLMFAQVRKDMKRIKEVVSARA